MDIRRDVCGVLVVGSPAAGINAIISAITIECLNQQINVIGFLEGWKHLRRGLSSSTISLTMERVSRITTLGGSVLKMSHMSLDTDGQIDNALRALRHLRVKFLIIIGDQIQATYRLCRRARQAQFPINVSHVPKSIFNDLYLPSDCNVIGYSSARDFGVDVVHNLRTDAKTMVRWYVITVIGSKSGHLTLGIAKSAAATLALVPEQFPKGVTVKQLVDHVDATIIKRFALGKGYGVVLLTEGLVEKMSQEELQTRFNGSLDSGHRQLSQLIVDELEARWCDRERDLYIKCKDIGPELRSADPNPTDIEIGRNTGYAAVKSLLRGDNGNMTVIKGDNFASIPLTELVHQDTLEQLVRQVDVTSLAFTVSQQYMIRLVKEDLANKPLLYKICSVTKLTEDEFIQEFGRIAVSRHSKGNSYEIIIDPSNRSLEAGL